MWRLLVLLHLCSHSVLTFCRDLLHELWMNTFALQSTHICMYFWVIQIISLFFPQKMDKNKDGVVTLEEFVIACQEVCTLLFLSCVWVFYFCLNIYIYIYWCVYLHNNFYIKMFLNIFKAAYFLLSLEKCPSKKNDVVSENGHHNDIIIQTELHCTVCC